MAVIVQRGGVRVVAFQKCGHTSIVNMFLAPAGEPLVRGRSVPHDYALRGDVEAALSWPRPHLTIAFFRNPLQRALSTYEHFIKRTLIHPEESNGGPLSLGRQSFTDLGFHPNMEFKDFILHLRNIDLSADKHLKPQHLSFDEALASVDVYGGQLEQLNTTWPLIVDQYGLDCTKEVAQYNKAEYEQIDIGEARLGLFKQLYATDYRYWEACHFEARAPLSSEYH